MKILFFAALAIGWTCYSPRALARLDETPDECAARYGTPLKGVDNETLPGTTDTHYAKNGVTIVITFLHGHAVNIVFSKENDAEFSASDLQTLLTANKGSSSWGAPTYSNNSESDSKRATFWERMDGASAVLLPSHALVMRTKAYKDESARIAAEQLEAAKRAQAGEANLKSF